MISLSKKNNAYRLRVFAAEHIKSSVRGGVLNCTAYIADNHWFWQIQIWFIQPSSYRIGMDSFQ